MAKRVAFIGHRNIYDRTLRERLKEVVQNEINNGCEKFIMGMHGAFDNMALSVCRELRNINKTIEIEVVLTSLNTIKNVSEYVSYSDVFTSIYEIEEVHYKRQIIVSNQKMIDDSDVLICYVDKNVARSGAKIALKYAEKRGVKIINLFTLEKSIQL